MFQATAITGSHETAVTCGMSLCIVIIEDVSRTVVVRSGSASASSSRFVCVVLRCLLRLLFVRYSESTERFASAQS